MPEENQYLIKTFKYVTNSLEIIYASEGHFSISLLMPAIQ